MHSQYLDGIKPETEMGVTFKARLGAGEASVLVVVDVG
jgi:hypothetical protein